MRVLIGWPPVSRPSRVADACRAVQRISFQNVLEVGELADPLAAKDPAAVDDGNSRGIVAAILEPAQPVQQDGHDVTRPHIPDNSTHTLAQTASTQQTPDLETFCRQDRTEVTDCRLEIAVDDPVIEFRKRLFFLARD